MTRVRTCLLQGCSPYTLAVKSKESLRMRSEDSFFMTGRVKEDWRMYRLIGRGNKQQNLMLSSVLYCYCLFTRFNGSRKFVYIPLHPVSYINLSCIFFISSISFCLVLSSKELFAISVCSFVFYFLLFTKEAFTLLCFVLLGGGTKEAFTTLCFILFCLSYVFVNFCYFFFFFFLVEGS